MGVVKILIIIFLILVAIAHFVPQYYSDGRGWLVNKVEQKTSPTFGKIVGGATDLTKFYCETDKNCRDEFDMSNLRCSSFNQCYVFTNSTGVS